MAAMAAMAETVETVETETIGVTDVAGLTVVPSALIEQTESVQLGETIQTLAKIDPTLNSEPRSSR